MASKYDKRRKQRYFEKEHWYVTNVDHISLKVQMTTGRLLISVIHDKTDYSFTLPDTNYMNLYTDLIWVKNKLGLTIWNRNKMSYFI